MNFDFTWMAVNAEGETEGVYVQTIYGETLAEAVETFDTMHGPLTPDEDGTSLVIIRIVAG